MTPKQFKSIRQLMEDWLGDEGSGSARVTGHPAWCYETLGNDMAKAAQLVYDASMEAQAFAEKQRS